MPRVFIPAELRAHCGGAEAIDVDAQTVNAAISAVEGLYPGIRERLCDGTRLRPGLMVSINGSFATLGLREPVVADSEIHFLPAIGGG